MYSIKWILASFGFIFWGWTGFFVGFFVGGFIQLFVYFINLPDSPSDKSNGKQDNTARQRSATSTSSASSQFKSPAMNLKNAITIMMAAVMKADGVVTKAELNHIKPFLVKKYGEVGALEALQSLKYHIQSNSDYSAAALFTKSFSYDTRLEILHILLGVAHADGVVNLKEELIAKSISSLMGISETDFKQIHSLFHQSNDSSWAYHALGIERTASDEEVKKAYRLMALKYHPDKVAGASPELERSANERFRKIIEAYDYIKKERNLT